MSRKYRCVVDNQGFYLRVVQVDDNSEVISGGEMKTGERLVDTRPPSGLNCKITPQNIWVETASADALERAKKERYLEAGKIYPSSEVPSNTTEALALEMTILMAEQQENNEQAITELTMLIAELGGL